MQKHHEEKEKPEPKEKPKAESAAQPECDPALGDLTPAYVEWFKKNRPAAEFKEKYLGRIPELQEKPEDKESE